MQFKPFFQVGSLSLSWACLQLSALRSNRQFTFSVKKMIEAVNMVFLQDGVFEHMELPARHAVTMKSQ
jgi:hypothetical protein